MDFPPIPKDLLDHLDKLFPERCPDDSMTDRQIWMAAGARSVIRLLRREFDDQNETVIQKVI